MPPDKGVVALLAHQTLPGICRMSAMARAVPATTVASFTVSVRFVFFSEPGEAAEDSSVLSCVEPIFTVVHVPTDTSLPTACATLKV